MSDPVRCAQPLTERQRFWLQHLQACGNGSLKAYAGAHGLSLSALYQAKSTLRRRGQLHAQPTPVRLARVERSGVAPGAAPSARGRVLLPNGVAVEFACAPADWPALLGAVAVLP